jgi:hypothetical protein
VQQLRQHRVWIAALWLTCQGVAIAAAPGRLICSYAGSMLSAEKHEQVCCKGGRLCPMHQQRKDSGHTGGHHHGEHAVPSTVAPSKDPLAIDAASSSDHGLMQAACTPQPLAILPVLLVPGVVPGPGNVADDLGRRSEIAEASVYPPTRTTSPDFPPPR